MTLQSFKNFISNRWPFISIVIISFLLPAIWLKERLVIAYAEPGFTFLINPLRLLNLSKYTWWDIFGLGMGNTRALCSVSYYLMTSVLQFLKLSAIARQYLVFVAILLLSSLSVYFLAIELLRNKKEKPQFIALIVALFYILNPYTMNIWHRFTSSIFGLPLLPLIFLITIKLLKKPSFKYAFLFAAVTLLFSVNAINPGYFIPLFFPVVFYMIFEILRTRRFRQWRYFGLAIFLAIGLNFWWLLPLSNSAQAEYVRTTSLLTGTLKAISHFTPILFISRLIDSATIHWWGVNYHPGWIEFLIPLLAVIAILFGIKQNRNILFFALLLIIGLFLGKGIQPPGGFIYRWMFSYIPFLGMFRSPFEKFGLIIAFSYSFLVPLGIPEIQRLIKKKPVGIGIRVAILILLFGVSIWPMWTGDLFSFYEGAILEGAKNVPTAKVKIPDYWKEAANYINQDRKDYRMVFLPQAPFDGMIYKWKYGYAGADFGSVNLLFNRPVITQLIGSSYADAYRKLVLEDLFLTGTRIYPSLFSPMNTDYILVRNDVNEAAIVTVPLAKIHQLLDSSEFVHKVRSFGKLDLYKLEDKYFLPHIYVSRKTIYSDGGVESLIDIVSFEDWEIRSGIHIADNADMDADNVEDADRIFVVGQCIRCDLSEKAEIKLPFVRFLPDSIFYPLISFKEKRWEKKIRSLNDPTQIIDLDLGLASKRLAEVERLVDEEKGEETVKETMKRYQARIEDLSSRLRESEKEGGDINEAFLRIGDYLKKHKEVLRGLLGRELSGEIRIRFKNALWKVEDLLVEIKSKQWVSEEGVRRYILDIPKETEYELLIKNEEIKGYFVKDPLSPVVFELDGKLAIKPGELWSDGWILVDKVNLGKGKHKLAITLPEIRNLVEKEALFLEQGEEEGKTVSLPINNFDYAGLYKISFDYKTLRGKPAKFIVLQDTDKKDEELRRVKHKIEEGLPRDVLPQTFEAFFKPDLGAKKAELEFIIEADEKEKSVFEIEKIRVERVWSPKVVLRTIVDNTEKALIIPEVPKITFRKINPTKYEVGVEGAREPYTLIFLESFHEGWKAYISNQQSAISNQPESNIIASYFDGEIKEGKHRDIFLDRNTFETWGKKPIPENRHYLVNGYANSWHITPEDAGGAENYEIIIEFWPQRLFYIGSGVSLITLLSCLSYLFWQLGRKRLVIRRRIYTND